MPSSDLHGHQVLMWCICRPNTYIHTIFKIKEEEEVEEEEEKGEKREAVAAGVIFLICFAEVLG